MSEIVKITELEAQLSVIQQQAEEVLATGITDKKSFEKAKKVRMSHVTLRTTVEKKRVEITSPLNQSIKQVNALAKGLTERIEAGEKPIKLLEDAYNLKLKQEEERLAQEKEERVLKRVAVVTSLSAVFNGVLYQLGDWILRFTELENMSDEAFQEKIELLEIVYAGILAEKQEAERLENEKKEAERLVKESEALEKAETERLNQLTRLNVETAQAISDVKIEEYKQATESSRRQEVSDFMEIFNPTPPSAKVYAVMGHKPGETQTIYEPGKPGVVLGENEQLVLRNDGTATIEEKPVSFPEMLKEALKDVAKDATELPVTNVYVAFETVEFAKMVDELIESLNKYNFSNTVYFGIQKEIREFIESKI